jgi:hypothetical protein
VATGAVLDIKLGYDKKRALNQCAGHFREVDGVRMIFQDTPNTEAPREMNTYIPDVKAAPETGRVGVPR